MNDYTNLSKKNYKRNLSMGFIILIVIAGVFLLDFFSCLPNPIGAILICIDMAIIAIGLIVIFILYIISKKYIYKIEKELNKHLPLEYKFSFSKAFCTDYVLESNFTDKEVTATSIIEGTINDVIVERFYIELYNKASDIIKTDKIHAAFYVYKNTCDSEIECFIMPRNYKWNLNDDKLKLYVDDDIKVYYNQSINPENININLDKPYFISVVKSNAYVYLFDIEDKFNYNNIVDKNYFSKEINKEIELIEEIYNILKNIIKRNS